MVEESKKKKELEVPGLEQVMELISFPRWEIKQHPTMGMHGLRIPETPIFLALPGGREPLEALRAAHEREVDSYRKRIFMLLSRFEMSGDDLAKMEGIPEEEREAFSAWAASLLEHVGWISRHLILDGEAIVDSALAQKQTKEGPE